MHQITQVSFFGVDAIDNLFDLFVENSGRGKLLRSVGISLEQGNYLLNSF